MAGSPRSGALWTAKDSPNTPIMAYSAKYASAFYGPFREAADSAPQFGDRRSYQMDPPNAREALREIATDIQEGADIVMVKPALAYLDIIAAGPADVQCPIAAYQVSGEYAMIEAAARNGWIDRERTILETTTAIKRAGADILITYYALELARSLMSRSEDLFARALERIPGGVNSPVRAFRSVGGKPLFIARGEGSRIWDVDGQEYIDYVGSWGPLLFGHRPPEVLAALEEVLRTGRLLALPRSAKSNWRN